MAIVSEAIAKKVESKDISDIDIVTPGLQVLQVHSVKARGCILNNDYRLSHTTAS